MPTTLVEISHDIHHGMPAYPGLPEPKVSLHLDHAGSRTHYDDQAEFAIGRIEFVGNVGTYLDSPYHRFRGEADIAQLPLGRLVDLPTTVVDVRHEVTHRRRLDLTLPQGSLTGCAVLIRSGWDARWGTAAYWEPGPYLGEVLVEQLLDHDPALVGVDCWNVDDPDNAARPVHTTLLREGIPIVEHLTNLGSVQPNARTFVVPLAVRGAPSMPVRAFAITDQL